VAVRTYIYLTIMVRTDTFEGSVCVECFKNKIRYVEFGFVESFRTTIFLKLVDKFWYLMIMCVY